MVGGGRDLRKRFTGLLRANAFLKRFASVFLRALQKSKARRRRKKRAAHHVPALSGDKINRKLVVSVLSPREI